MATNTIRVGIVGTGFMGAAHTEALRRIPNIRVEAIAGSSRKKAEEKAAELGIPDACEDYRELVRRGDIEAVHVCTPNHLHFPVAREALRRGKHVLCEKPLCMTAKEGEILLRDAEKAGVVHATAYNLRYYPILRNLKRLMDKEALGRILALHGSYLQDWLLHESDFNWRIDPARGGSSRVVADIGTHWMDCVEFITGHRISEVFADFSTVHPVRSRPKESVETFSARRRSKASEDYAVASEDWAEILLRFESGVKAVFVVSQISAGRKNRLFFEVDGARQAVAWNSEAPNSLWFGRRDRENGVLMKDPALFDAKTGRICDYPGGHQEGYPDTFKYLFRDFYAAVRAKSPRGQEWNFPTFREGLRGVRLCEAVVRSAAKGRWTAVSD